jgi:hypothetical protein
MAVSTSTTIAALLREIFAAEFESVVHQRRDMLNFFGVEKGEGQGIWWKAHYAGNTSVGAIAEDADLPAAGTQSYMDAKLGWRTYVGTVEYTELAKMMAAGDKNGFMNGVIDLTRRLMDDLATKMSDDLMGAGGSNAFEGVAAAIQAAGSYATIDASVYTWWQSLIDSAIGALAESNIQVILRDLEEQPRGAKINVALCGPTVFNIVGNLFRTNPRFIQGSSGSKITEGFSAIEYQGVPFLKIPNYTAQRIDFLQKDLWHFKVLQGVELIQKPSEKLSERFVARAYANLQCRNPRKQGACTGITS